MMHLHKMRVFLFLDDAGTDGERYGVMLGNEVMNSSPGNDSLTSQPLSSLAAHPPPARTLSSVLKRLSHIVAGRTQVAFSSSFVVNVNRFILKYELRNILMHFAHVIMGRTRATW
jgi:hypothetical protein